MTQGFDRNLQVLTARAFQEILRRAAALNIADPLARMLLRLVLGTAVELTAGKNETVAIPDDLKKYASLEDNVVLIGQGDYFEIWAAEQWVQQEVQIRDAEQNSSRFAVLTVATR